MRLNSFYRALTSLTFSVAVLAFLLLATLLGTLILQDAHPEKFAQTYGSWAPLLRSLGLHDIFHSRWFEGAVALLGLSLLLAGFQRPNLRASRFGHLLCHLGAAVILAGAALGHFRGFKGFMALRKGEAKGEAVAMKWGVPAGESRALGFSLRLEDFQVERHAPDFRLRLYQRDGEDFSVKKSMALKEAKGWILAGQSQSFRLVQAFPDFFLKVELKEAEGGKGPAGLQLEFGEAVVPLLAGVTGREAALLPSGIPAQFVWDPPRAEVLAALEGSDSVPERALLVLGKSREVLALEKGRVARRDRLGSDSGPFPGIPGARYRIFPSAQESRTPSTRSEEWIHPVAAIELRKGEEESSIYMLSADHRKPLLFPDGNTVLAFERKADDIKAYRSRIAVMNGASKTLERTLAVNAPLHVGGYSFYQSDFREEDPDYSGLLVVRDPGLPWIWTGFAMICAGVAWTFYVRPRTRRREES